MKSPLLKKIFKIFFLCFDLFLISLAFFLAWVIRFYGDSNLLASKIESYIGILFSVLIVWSILCYALDLLHVPRTTKRINSSFWHYVFYPQFFLISTLLVTIVFFNYDEIPRLFLLIFIGLEISFLAISKKIRSESFKFLRISGLNLIKLAFISSNDDIQKMKKWLNVNSNSGFKFENLEMESMYTNSIKECLQLVDILNHGDYLILNHNQITKKEAIQIKEKSENKGIHIYRLLTDKRYSFLKGRNIKGLSEIGSFKLINLRKISVKNGINIINKRTFDFIFSLLFIFFIYWWVYLIVSIMIKIQSKGPVLFKQERIGLDGEKFMCYKFRTMHIDNSNSKIITQVGDSRVFSFGLFIRKLNIDEFPQFINVFKGEMSVVGPRPHMVSEDNMLADKIEKYRMRRWVKPGITGFAAIKGFRGGTESMELMQKRINLDVRYIEKWSFWLDIKICYYTILEMIFLKSKGH